jgi:hypothetical protein
VRCYIDCNSYVDLNRNHPHVQQISSLEQALEEVRSASVPKTKFTFKRKTVKPRLSVPPSPHPSSRSANEPGEGDATLGTLAFHRLSSHSYCGLSLPSISTLGAGPPSFDLTISDLDHCVVDLRGTADTVHNQNQPCLTALQARDLRETILILPNAKGSVLLQNLNRCTVIVACHKAGILLSVWWPALLILVVSFAPVEKRPRIPRCNVQTSYRGLLFYRLCRIPIIRVPTLTRQWGFTT